ncbi:brain-specific serine protease 4-like [Penaeus japonicus]|uniref:brain-specific serine protease 4-like n=1 Tax=Penaeus japonicus TaxID=27405 RepID=UPI001C7147BD|nr:brain-specific serine protease 4-like [Penaeus japonicus]
MSAKETIEYYRVWNIDLTHVVFRTLAGRVGGSKDSMQEVEVPVISNDECARMFLRSGGIVSLPRIMMCAGYAEGKKDACERDGVWNLEGVISWGIGRASSNQPGVYTRISEFREWIQKITVF